MITWIKLFYAVSREKISAKRCPENMELQAKRLPASSFYRRSSISRALYEVLSSYLISSGWTTSRLVKRSVDAQGRYVPWLTYPCIAYLETLDLTDKKILEFGGGASTVYFAERSKQVWTIETDPNYSRVLRHLDLTNVEVIDFQSHDPLTHTDLGVEIERVALLDAQYTTRGEIETVGASISLINQLISRADLILIDGGPRHLYSKLVSQSAKDSAIVVIDNTDMDVLEGITEYFTDGAYLKVPMAGLGPLNAYGWVTTVLLRKTVVTR